MAIRRVSVPALLIALCLLSSVSRAELVIIGHTTVARIPSPCNR